MGEQPTPEQFDLCHPLPWTAEGDTGAIAMQCEHPPVLHPGGQGEPLDALVVCTESSGAMKTMRLCAWCAPAFAYQIAQLAVESARMMPDAQGVTISITPLTGRQVQS